MALSWASTASRISALRLGSELSSMTLRLCGNMPLGTESGWVEYAVPLRTCLNSGRRDGIEAQIMPVLISIWDQRRIRGLVRILSVVTADHGTGDQLVRHLRESPHS